VMNDNEDRTRRMTTACSRMSGQQGQIQVGMTEGPCE
jgi:hypothetical protein